MAEDQVFQQDLDQDPVHDGQFPVGHVLRHPEVVVGGQHGAGGVDAQRPGLGQAAKIGF